MTKNLPPPGRVIFLNGTSSSGKSTIATALRQVLPDSFCYYASDQLADAGFRALTTSPKERARFFEGFHHSIAAFAARGNDLLVEHIVEEPSWATDIKNILRDFDVFWVGVHCDQATLLEREKHRKDRKIGESAFHLKTHEFCTYDFEVRNGPTPNELATTIHNAWQTVCEKQRRAAR